MAKKTKSSTQEAQTPLILRCHRLMEAFAKSDDERDFYLDRIEGFIVYVDLDKIEEELNNLSKELTSQADRYCMIPKLTFYETKKIMEGFVHEKVYDIDTKEKLLDIIGSREARENFLEFIYDHHSELEKWQQFYQERSRIRIIEWLRNNHFHFVFEEDLDLSMSMLEKLKRHLFDKDVAKDIQVARKSMLSKAKTYYSNEALNPRPKRGRPPKQAAKLDLEPQVTTDIYTTVPSVMRPFLFSPDITSMLDVTFSAKFESGEVLMAAGRGEAENEPDSSLTNINKKLEALKSLSSKWLDDTSDQPIEDEDDDDDDDDEFSHQNNVEVESLTQKKLAKRKAPAKKKVVAEKKKVAPKKTKAVTTKKRIIPQTQPKKSSTKPKAKAAPKAKKVVEKKATTKKKPLRRTTKK